MAKMPMEQKVEIFEPKKTYSGSAKTLSQTYAPGEVWLGFIQGGGYGVSAYNSVYLFFASPENHASYIQLVKGSDSTISASINTTNRTFTLSCTTTTLNMGFVRLYGEKE